MEPVPDNIQRKEMNTDQCGGCDDEVVLEDIHTDYCSWCDSPCHESCATAHEDYCDEKPEDDEERW